MFAHASEFFHFHGELALISLIVIGGFFAYRLLRKKG